MVTVIYFLENFSREFENMFTFHNFGKENCNNNKNSNNDGPVLKDIEKVDVFY